MPHPSRRGETSGSSGPSGRSRTACRRLHRPPPSPRSPPPPPGWSPRRRRATCFVRDLPGGHAGYGTWPARLPPRSSPPRCLRSRPPAPRCRPRPSGWWYRSRRSSMRSPIARDEVGFSGAGGERRWNPRGTRWPLLPRLGGAKLDARDVAGTGCAACPHLARVFTHAERLSPAPGPAPASAASAFRAARRALGSRAPPRLSRAYGAILDRHGREHVCLKDSKRGRPSGGGRLRGSSPGGTGPGQRGVIHPAARVGGARLTTPD